MSSLSEVSRLDINCNHSLQALRFAEGCASVELRARGRHGNSAALALGALDAEISAMETIIKTKERWETRVVRRRDVRAGAKFGLFGEADTVYRTDQEVEEYKVSGLVGAETERAHLERMLQALMELVGAA